MIFVYLLQKPAATPTDAAVAAAAPAAAAAAPAPAPARQWAQTGEKAMSHHIILNISRNDLMLRKTNSA